MLCTIDNCGKEATHTFVWPWGAEGACCQDHLVVVQQKAKNARGRFGQVSFTRLDPDRPKELRRDERIELHSSRLVAESERDDARIRAAKLFEVNTDLQRELRALRVRVSQFEAQVKELGSQVELAIRERDDALVLVSKAREELEQWGLDNPENLRDRHTPTEVPHPPEAPEPTRHVVEGSPARDEHGRFAKEE